MLISKSILHCKQFNTEQLLKIS